jgi:hypothetical protein
VRHFLLNLARCVATVLRQLLELLMLGNLREFRNVHHRERLGLLPWYVKA